jgi:ABC-2 type transport system permease protein
VTALAGRSTGTRTGTGTGTGTLTKLALRRDRLMIPGWLYALAASVVGTAATFRSLYGEQSQRAGLARSMNASGPLRALCGPVYDWNSVGALTAWRMGVLGAALAGLMSILLVVRHTRDEEESGRQEMLGATAIDRRAPLTAALAVTVTANTAILAVTAAGMAVLGQSFAGSVALGLQIAGGGLVFGALAAVTAQLTEGARAARGLAGALLGAAFLLRGAGDAAYAGSGSAAVWASPLGWLEHLRPYDSGGESWWVLLPAAALATAAAAAAYALAAHRDCGAGLLPVRPGPAAGARGLNGPFALAWRLQRGAWYGWAFGLAVAGAVYGSVARSVGDLVGGNAQVDDLIERMGGRQGLTDSFLALSIGLLGTMTGVYAVQSLLRLRAEENGLGAEAVLAHPVGRLRWAASHLALAVLGSAVLLAAAGTVLGLVHGAAAGDIGGQVPRLAFAAVAQAPGVWVLAGLGTVLFGLLPRAVPATWGLLGLFLALGQLGPVLRVPQPVMDLSPFTHLPGLPGGHGDRVLPLSATPYLWLVPIAAAAFAVGLTGLRRRDLTAGA